MNTNLVIACAFLGVTTLHGDDQAPKLSSKEALVAKVRHAETPTAEIEAILIQAAESNLSEIFVEALKSPRVDLGVYAIEAAAKMNIDSKRIILKAALERDDLWNYSERYGWNLFPASRFEHGLLRLLGDVLGREMPVSKPDFEDPGVRRFLLTKLATSNR